MQKSNPQKEIFNKQSQPQPDLEEKMDPQPQCDSRRPGMKMTQPAIWQRKESC